MDNIFTYNLNDLDTSQLNNRPVNMKTIQQHLKKINSGFLLKKYLGTSYGGDIFLVRNESSSSKNTNNRFVNIKKIICKKVDISSTLSNSSSKNQIEKYIKIINSIKRHPIGRQFVNGIINYKFVGNYLYVCMPYYKGVNLEQLYTFLETLNNKDYLTIITYLVKKILRGLISFHKMGIYHNNLTTQNIIVNTQNKKMDVKVKFYDLSKQNKRKSLKKQHHQISSKNMNEREKNDIEQCGRILLNLITKRFIDNHNLNNKKKSLKYSRKKNKKSEGIFSSLFSFFKSDNDDNKNDYNNSQSSLENLVPEELHRYITIIKDNMINKQRSLYNSLKEILLDEKYNDTEDNNNN